MVAPEIDGNIDEKIEYLVTQHSTIHLYLV